MRVLESSELSVFCRSYLAGPTLAVLARWNSNSIGIKKKILPSFFFNFAGGERPPPPLADRVLSSSSKLPKRPESGDRKTHLSGRRGVVRRAFSSSSPTFFKQRKGRTWQHTVTRPATFFARNLLQHSILQGGVIGARLNLRASDGRCGRLLLLPRPPRRWPTRGSAERVCHAGRCTSVGPR